MEPRNSLTFANRVKGALAHWVLCCDTDRAMVGVAGLGLDAANCKHVTARRVAPVRPHRECPGDVKRGHNFTRRPDFNPISQAGAALPSIRTAFPDNRVVDVVAHPASAVAAIAAANVKVVSFISFILG